jgi:hypothetical protein
MTEVASLKMAVDRARMLVRHGRAPEAAIAEAAPYGMPVADVAPRLTGTQGVRG